MKAWEKAKEKFPSLSRVDFIADSCPDILGILDSPEYCMKGLMCATEEECTKCWDRDIEEVEIAEEE